MILHIFLYISPSVSHVNFTCILRQIAGKGQGINCPYKPLLLDKIYSHFIVIFLLIFIFHQLSNRYRSGFKGQEVDNSWHLAYICLTSRLHLLQLPSISRASTGPLSFIWDWLLDGPVQLHIQAYKVNALSSLLWARILICIGRG